MNNTFYENLKLDFPSIYNGAEDITQSGPYELIVKHSDGCIYAYSTLTRNLRRISKSHFPTDEEYAKALGRKLSSIAYMKGINQVDLAEALGVTQPTVSGYMTGRVVPSIPQLRRIARFFNVPFDSIILML